MWDKIYEFWNSFIDFIYSCVLSVGEILKDVLIWAFDGLMGIVTVALDAIGGLFSSLNVVGYLDFIPIETRNMMALAGINEATSIIVAAIIIRLSLQLIPFTRLGS